MQIREAEESDADRIALLHAKSWRVAYRGMLSDEYLDGNVIAERRSVWAERFRSPAANQYVAVAEVDQSIVGFACAFGAHDRDWGTLLENLHVAQEHKRSGIGAQLMAHVAEWCANACPGSGLHLWVLEPNTAARAFYESLGAAHVERSVWSAPGGSEVPELRFAWPDLDVLLRRASRAASSIGGGAPRQSPASADGRWETPSGRRRP